MKKWKIIQVDPYSYVLLLDVNTIQKITGKNAPDIVKVLNFIQDTEDFEKAKKKLLDEFTVDKLSNIIRWLEVNKFIEYKKSSNKKFSINLIGLFDRKLKYLENFIDSLPKNIILNNIYNLNHFDKSIFSDRDEILNLIIAPFWFNSKYIDGISDWMYLSKNDFLYVELFHNGITIGPLMNLRKGTVCLNCIELRKLLNTSKPDLIIENILSKDIVQVNQLGVFAIGNYELNKVFIINELQKIIKGNKNLYNKSIFTDYNHYENQFFEVVKSPMCKTCSEFDIVYNPL